MRIKEITSQNRRDFSAIYVCEHCGDETKGTGYDDKFFHARVIPTMVCEKCGKQADEKYRPLATKYEEGHQV